MENFRDQEEQQQRQAAAAAAARVVHSQVRKIKEEEGDKVKVHETYQPHVAEMRLVLRDLGSRQQRSRSPLGRAGRPAISIGGDS